MFFESRETKFGIWLSFMAIWKSSELAFFSCVSHCQSCRKSKNYASRTKKKKGRLVSFFTLPWRTTTSNCVCQLWKNHGEKFRSQNTSPVAGTSPYWNIVIARQQPKLYMCSAKNSKSPRHFWQDSDNLHTCSMSPCRPVNEGCVCFFRREFTLSLRPKYTRKGPNIWQNPRSLTGRQGLAEHVNFFNLSLKNGADFRFFLKLPNPAWTSS